VCCALPRNLSGPPHRIFPPLNLHRARVRRNHGRPRPNGCIGRAPSALPVSASRRERASDTALALIRWDEKAGHHGMRYAPKDRRARGAKEKEACYDLESFDPNSRAQPPSSGDCD
jgi:hypothetical protein